MPIALRRLLGLPEDVAAPALRDWLWALGPLAAPLLMMLAPFSSGGAPSLQSEFVLAALVWMLLLVPGLLAANLLFAPSHPLGRGVSRFSIASILALVPFCLPAWAGCLLHWRLGRALWIYAALYVLATAALGFLLVRGGPAREGAPAPAPSSVEPRPWPRWAGAVIIVLIVLVMVGVCRTSPPMERTKYFVPALRSGWWKGTLLGFAASAAAGVVILAAGRRREDAGPTPASVRAATKTTTRRGSKREDAPPPAFLTHVQTALVAALWLTAGLLVVHLMRITYSDRAPERGVLPWNVDDVAYVTEAVDYQYNEPMGLYEPSIGSDHGLQRSGMSPLIAPLVAMISRFTGISCPALHHGVLPSLMLLLGGSALAAALMVVFRQHRWLVPLGLITCWLAVHKTWDYERTYTEMVVFRAVQTKSIHLLLVYPIQLAAAILVILQPNGRHVLLAVLTALVGYLVHPLAAIQGVIWSGTMLVAAAIWWRRAIIPTGGVLAAYALLCGSYYLETRIPLAHEAPASGRQEGSPIQSRDLVRVDALLFNLPAKLRDELASSPPSAALREAFAEHKVTLRPEAVLTPEEGTTESWMIEDRASEYRVRAAGDSLAVYQVAAQPVMRLDPFWEFGCDTMNLMGSLSVPVLLAFGWRRKEWLLVGMLGASGLLLCNCEPIGRMLSAALPPAIFWRAKWFIPAIVNLAGLAAVLYYAVGALFDQAQATWSGLGGFALTVPPLVAFPVMLAGISSTRLEVGDPPKMLTKFSPDMHELVNVLGGIEASPFVFGTFLVHHELPQLMPHIKLVFSRDKIMRIADDPSYRQIAVGVQQQITAGSLNEGYFKRLCHLYPIDHVVLDHRRDRTGKKDIAEQPVAVLKKLGWTPAGRAGLYEVWKRPAARASNEASSP